MANNSRYIVLIIVIASIGGIIYGFSILEENPAFANKCIGFGTVGLFLIAMPLFLFKESKGKKAKDYMLTEENIRKMQGRADKKPEDEEVSSKK
jgi:cyanate permease